MRGAATFPRFYIPRENTDNLLHAHRHIDPRCRRSYISQIMHTFARRSRAMARVALNSNCRTVRLRLTSKYLSYFLLINSFRGKKFLCKKLARVVRRAISFTYSLSFQRNIKFYFFLFGKNIESTFNHFVKCYLLLKNNKSL